MSEWDNFWKALNGGDISPDASAKHYLMRMEEIKTIAKHNRIQWQCIERIEREAAAVSEYFRVEIENYISEKNDTENRYMYYMFPFYSMQVEHIAFNTFRLQIKCTPVYEDLLEIICDFFNMKNISVRSNNITRYGRGRFELSVYFHVKTIIPFLLKETLTSYGLR